MLWFLHQKAQTVTPQLSNCLSVLFFIPLIASDRFKSLEPWKRCGNFPQHSINKILCHLVGDMFLGGQNWTCGSDSYMVFMSTDAFIKLCLRENMCFKPQPLSIINLISLGWGKSICNFYKTFLEYSSAENIYFIGLVMWNLCSLAWIL